jgi:hypothetical protein
MNNRTVSAFALASVLALASTPGHALSFDFSFSNVSGDTNGTVTGVIEGLTDNGNVRCDRCHCPKLSSRINYVASSAF